jgi:hypothetical protein
MYFISPSATSHPPTPAPQQMDQWAAEKSRLHTQAAHAVHQFESVHEFDELRRQAGGGPPGVLCADTERLLLIVSGTCQMME